MFSSTCQQHNYAVCFPWTCAAVNCTTYREWLNLSLFSKVLLPKSAMQISPLFTENLAEKLVKLICQQTTWKNKLRYNVTRHCEECSGSYYNVAFVTLWSLGSLQFPTLEHPTTLVLEEEILKICNITRMLSRKEPLCYQC